MSTHAPVMPNTALRNRICLRLLLPLLALLAACGGGGDTLPAEPPPPPPTANQAPTARFDAPTAVVAGQAAVFDARASTDPEGGALRFTWDFGDGSAAGTAQVAHLYPAAGTYTAKLMVSDDQGATAEVTRSVTVSAAALAARSVSVAGRVTGIDGLPLAGVSVTVQGGTGAGSSGAADADGRATLSVGVGVNVVLRLSKAGYTDQVKQLNLPGTVGTDGSFEASMMPRAAALTLADAAAGGRVTGTDGVGLVLPAAALVDAATGAAVTGAVQVTMTPVDVNAAAIAAFPGRFEGINSDGTRTPIVSFGTTEFLITQGGRPLQLKPAARATIDLPVYASRALNGAELVAGGSLPLWSLDERSGLWVNEGSGVLVASAAAPTGLAMRAEVGHFSWWNIDFSFDPYVPKPRCINDVPGQYDNIFAQATICNMLAELDKPIPAQGSAAARQGAQALAVRAVPAASTQPIPFPPAFRVEASVPIAGGVSIGIPANYTTVLTGTALNGTWRGQVKVFGAVGATDVVTVPLRPVAAGSDIAELITLPFDQVRAASALRTDRYRFVAAAGQGLQVSVSQASSTLTGTVRLRDNTGAVLATSAVAASAGQVAYKLATAGEYTLEFEPLLNAPGGYRMQAAFSGLLSLTVVDPDSRPDVAQVAVNPAGDALLVWSSFAAPSGRTVLARTFNAAGQLWSATQTLAVLAAFDPATSVLLGMDDAGNATVVMAQGDAGTSAVRFDRGTGAWSAPLALGSANCPSQVGAQQRLAVNGRGDAWLVWMIDPGFGRSPSDSPGLCSRRYDTNTATWMPERRIDFAPGNGRLPSLPTLALASSANGQAVLAWTQSSAVLATRFVAATEDWGTVVSLANPSGGGYGLSLAMDANGTAMAAWVGTDNGVVAAVSEAATPAWRAAVPVGRGYLSAPVAAVPLGNNRFHVLWERPGGASPAIQGASWDPVALAWSGPQTVAAQGARLVAAAGDGVGSMVAVFSFQPGAGLTPVLGSSRWDAITSNWVIGAEPLSGPLVAGYWQPGTLRVAGGQAVVTWQQITDPFLSGGTWANVVGRLSAGP